MTDCLDIGKTGDIVPRDNNRIIKKQDAVFYAKSHPVSRVVSLGHHVKYVVIFVVEMQLCLWSYHSKAGIGRGIGKMTIGARSQTKNDYLEYCVWVCVCAMHHTYHRRSNTSQSDN